MGLSVNVLRHPLRLDRDIVVVPEGSSVREIIDHAGVSGAYVEINGHPVPVGMWDNVRPKGSAHVLVKSVAGDRGITRALGQIAVIAAATYFTGGIASLGWQLAARGALTVAGTYALNQIAPPPSPSLGSRSGTDRTESTTASIRGARNQADRYGPLPQILGRHRIVPPYGAEPYTELVGNDQYLRVLFAVAGPIDIDEDTFRIGDDPIANFGDVEYEFRQGFEDDEPLTLYSQQVAQNDEEITLREEDSWAVRTTTTDTDEISVDVTFPRGLVEISNSGGRLNREVRVEAQYRPVGGTDWTTIDSVRQRDASQITVPSSIRMVETRQPRNIQRTYEARTQYIQLNPSDDRVIVSTTLSDEMIPLAQVNATAVKQQNPRGVEWVYRVDSLTDLRPTEITDIAADNYEVTQASGRTMNVAAGERITDNLVVEAASTQPVRRSVHTQVPSRGQYEVRLRRVTPDTDNTQIQDEVVWTALRSITDEDPLAFDVPVAKIALRIRATDQLRGIVDRFSFVGTSYAWDWDSDEQDWIFQPTSNNAALIRQVLQGPLKARPLADKRLNLPNLIDFSQWCDAQGFNANTVVDYRGPSRELCQQLASAGRGSFGLVEGRHGVVVDREQSDARQMFTPRNSWGYQGNLNLKRQPHALKVRFLDETTDYEQQERIVYRDGFDSTNASRFDVLDLGPVTSPDQIYRLARYHLKVGELRREQHRVSVGYEHIGVQRGQRVAFQHDVPKAGGEAAKPGRVTGVITDAGDIVGITIDEPVEMEQGGQYAVTIRQPAEDALLTVGVQTDPGEHTELTLEQAVQGVEPGDLVAFFESEKGLIDGLVERIERQGRGSADIVVVPYAESLYEVDAETPPDWEPGEPYVDPRTPGPPRIISVQADSFAAERDADGRLRPGIRITLQQSQDGRSAATFQARYREVGTGQWSRISAPASDGQITIRSLIERVAYEVEVRAVGGEGLESEWISAGVITTKPKDGPQGRLTPPRVRGLELYEQGNNTTFTGRDAKFSWRRTSTSDWYEVGYEPQEEGLGAGGLDDFFDTYKVEVRDTDGSLRRRETTRENEWVYTLEKNQEDGDRLGTGPLREFEVVVFNRDKNAQLSGPTRITVKNPPMEQLTAVQVNAGYRVITARFNTPSERDFAGVDWWVETEQGFDPENTEPAVTTPDTTVPIDGLDGDTTYHVRWRPFDTFGRAGSPISSELQVSTLQIPDTANLGAWAEVDIGTRQEIEDWLSGEAPDPQFIPRVAAGQLIGGVIQATEVIQSEGLIQAVDDINSPSVTVSLGPVDIDGTAYLLSAEDDIGLTFGVDESGGFLFGGNTSNRMTFDGNVLEFSGDIVASDIKGSTITGSTLQTAADGERFEVDSGDNRARFFDDNNNEIVSIGSIDIDGEGRVVAITGFDGLESGLLIDQGASSTVYATPCVIQSGNSKALLAHRFFGHTLVGDVTFEDGRINRQIGTATNIPIASGINSSAETGRGSLAFARIVNDDVDFGDTRQGSDLEPAAASGANTGETLSGTWRCLGNTVSGTSAGAVTLWIKIAE